MSQTNEETILRNLEELKGKIDGLQQQRYENGIASTRIEGRVDKVETFIEDHKDLHRQETKFRRELNIKLWIMVIGVPVAILIALTKDSLF